MKYRKLRIAWSVVWGIAFAILIMLAVRSRYFYVDLVQVPLRFPSVFQFGSIHGRFHLGSRNLPPVAHKWLAENQRWETTTIAIENIPQEPDSPTWQMEVYKPPIVGWALVFPQSLPAALAAVLAGIPWLKLRFGLRTLLILTTLIAVGLGWAVYSLR